ncbi:MAG: glycosyltransferase family 2 protein [Candidatus Omnitrophica bacterium]|nr:glycosyltransferase family 2 protein [Candidatus Omnitrophota bacterium]
MTKISVVLNTFNEAELLERCLKNLIGLDEVVIIDMYSKDKTTEVAKKYTTNIYFHPRTISVLYARNFSLTKATGDWVLIVDPDEIVKLSLVKKLKEMTLSKEFDAVSIPFRMYFLSKPLKYAYPLQYKVRFFKKDKAIFVERVHTNPKIEGKIYNLPPNEDYIIEHRPNCSLKILFDKLSRYTTDEAKHLYFTDKKRGFFLDLLKKPIAEFYYRFILNKGYKDGFIGFLFSLYMAVYRFVLYFKLLNYTLKNKNNG